MTDPAPLILSLPFDVFMRIAWILATLTMALSIIFGVIRPLVFKAMETADAMARTDQAGRTVGFFKILPSRPRVVDFSRLRLPPRLIVGLYASAAVTFAIGLVVGVGAGVGVLRIFGALVHH